VSLIPHNAEGVPPNTLNTFSLDCSSLWETKVILSFFPFFFPKKKKKRKDFAHPGNRTPVSTVGGYYDTTTLDAPVETSLQQEHNFTVLCIRRFHKLYSKQYKPNYNFKSDKYNLEDKWAAIK